MQDAYDEERTEVLAYIKDAATNCLDTAMQLNNLLTDSGDIGEISYDAAATIVNMLQKLSKNYDIASLVADALEVD
jgi:hypothetical protein